MIDLNEDCLVLKRADAVDMKDVLFSILWPFFTILPFAIFDSQIFHWFILPLYLCGIVVGIDSIRWLRGKMDPYDPKGLIGLLGMHFFLIAPLIVVFYDAENVGGVYVPDWRPWLGKIAFFSFFGLLFYNLIQRYSYQKSSNVNRFYCALDQNKALFWTILTLCIVFSFHMIFMIKMGGLGGFLKVRTYGFQAVDVTGFGPFMVLGRSLPILVLIAITIFNFNKLDRKASLLTITTLLLIFLFIQILVSGLSGSRSSVMWGLFWAVGIIHFFWRKIPTSWILFAIIPFICFMYLYGFYKTLGTRAFKFLQQGSNIESLTYESGRTFLGMLVGDLSRADVQATQLYVLESNLWPYDYRYGSTYLTSVVPLIPRRLWPSKPSDAGKVIAGTELLYGKGTYQRKQLSMSGKRSTRIYGLTGEALLNFGIWGIVPAFCVWGYFVGFIRRKLICLLFKDLRFLLIPFWVNISFLILINDMSNHVAHILYKWLIPAILIFLITRKIPLYYSDVQ